MSKSVVKKEVVDFSKMDNRALKSFIEDKKALVKEYREKVDGAKTNEELALIGAKGEFYADQLEQARTEQDKRANEVLDGENRASANGFDPSKTFTTRSYSMNNGGNVENMETVKNTVENLALRSGETVAERLHLTNNEKLDLGKFVRGMYTGKWDGAEAEKRAYTTSATGVVIPQVLSAQIIDATRNVSLFESADVPIIPMTTNNLTIARVSKDPKFNFKAEGKEVVGNEDMALDSVKLKAKTIYGTAYVSIEAIESSQNLSEIIVQAFSQAMADGIDKGLLYGQGSDKFAPSGIMNDNAVNTVEATNERYNDFIRAIGAVRRANGVPTVMGINADIEELLNLLCDKNGVYLQRPKAVEDLKQIVSNQLKSDAENGSDALVFDPKAMVIGVQNDIRLRMITDSDECLKNGLVAFQIYSMVDAVATRPTHIAKITGIKEKVEA